MCLHAADVLFAFVAFAYGINVEFAKVCLQVGSAYGCERIGVLTLRLLTGVWRVCGKRQKQLSFWALFREKWQRTSFMSFIDEVRYLCENAITRDMPQHKVCSSGTSTRSLKKHFCGPPPNACAVAYAAYAGSIRANILHAETWSFADHETLPHFAVYEYTSSTCRRLFDHRSTWRHESTFGDMSIGLHIGFSFSAWPTPRTSNCFWNGLWRHGTSPQWNVSNSALWLCCVVPAPKRFVSKTCKNRWSQRQSPPTLHRESHVAATSRARYRSHNLPTQKKRRRTWPRPLCGHRAVGPKPHNQECSPKMFAVVKLSGTRETNLNTLHGLS